MCNLYRMTKPHAEVAGLFRTTIGSVGNVGGEDYPGYPGPVVAAGELRSMTWGFPLKLKGARPGSKPKSVNFISHRSPRGWNCRSALPISG